MGETPMPPYGPTMGGTPKALGLIRTWLGRLARGIGVARASRTWVWRGMGVPPMGLAWHGRLAHVIIFSIFIDIQRMPYRHWF